MSSVITGEDVAIGVFAESSQAQRAINELKRQGFTDREIGVVSHRSDDVEDISEPDETKAGEGAAAGALTGAGIGALWGLGILAGVIPGIGPAIAGGTMGILLSSAAAGAAAAGLAGTLIGLGIPEEEAPFYEDEFRAGRTIVTVQAGSRREVAQAILAQEGGYHQSSRGDNYRKPR